MTTTRAMLVGVVVWLVSVGIAGGYVLLSPDGIADTTFRSAATWLDVLKYNPIVRLPEFVVGMTIGHVFNAGGDRATMRRLAPWLGPGAVLLIAAVLVVGAPYPLLHNGLMTPFFGLLIYAVAMDCELLARFLGWRPLVVLGEASYALYILHLTLFVIARKVWAAAGALPESPAFFPMFLAAALVASIATYRYLELPMRSWLRARRFGMSETPAHAG
jgi:peptidoglycan/LPS O-acetylase OafA/YrhL